MCLVHENSPDRKSSLEHITRKIPWQFSKNHWLVDGSLSERRGPAETLKKSQYDINGSGELSFPSVQLMYLKSIMSYTA